MKAIVRLPSCCRDVLLQDTETERLHSRKTCTNCRRHVTEPEVWQSYNIMV